MSYVVGVSSGIFGAAPQEEKPQYAGLYKKAQYCITKGVEFVQIDLESISEFKDPDLKEKMESIKKLGISFGIHSEVAAFGGREFPHLDSAMDIDYQRGHERLIEVLKQTGELGSKFVLTHSSESVPFLLLGQQLQPTSLVDVWGRPLQNFLTDPGNEEIKDWIIEQPFTQEIYMHGRVFVTMEDLYKEQIEAIQRERRERFIESFRQQSGRHPTDEEINANFESRIKFIEDKEGDDLRKHLKEMLGRSLDSFLTTRSLSYGPERLAYYVIAKWMEDKNDDLWNNIINTSIKYYATIEKKTPEQWIEEKGIKKVDGKWSIRDEKFRLEYRIWVPAVSAKYVWGHLRQDTHPPIKKSDIPEVSYDDPKKYIKKYNMLFLLETPMASPGLESDLRFPNPVQVYWLVKEIGAEYIQMAIDIEHMLMSNQNPEISFSILPPDGGTFVRVIHAGWPAVIGPAHIPIPLGSDQQVYLYKMYYLLRQKGFGKDKSEYYLVFERGGGADPIQQSIIALRKIVEFLKDDIKPEDLYKHPDFFGLAIGEIGSMERQLVTIHEHGRDPLKGMIVVPEEEYGFLGKAAAEKGKAEVWKKEELR